MRERARRRGRPHFHSLTRRSRAYHETIGNDEAPGCTRHTGASFRIGAYCLWPFGRMVVPSCLDSKASALFFPGFRGDSWLDVMAFRDENTDWQIQTANSHGLRGLVNVFGMDGRSEATAALALADAIIDGIAERHTRSVYPAIVTSKLVMA